MKSTATDPSSSSVRPPARRDAATNLTPDAAVPLFAPVMRNHTNMKNHTASGPGERPRFFGAVKAGERGQVVTPQAGREDAG
jgi:hypothetical protein